MDAATVRTETNAFLGEITRGPKMQSGTVTEIRRGHGLYFDSQPMISSDTLRLCSARRGKWGDPG